MTNEILSVIKSIRSNSIVEFDIKKGKVSEIRHYFPTNFYTKAQIEKEREELENPMKKLLLEILKDYRYGTLALRVEAGEIINILHTSFKSYKI